MFRSTSLFIGTSFTIFATSNVDLIVGIPHKYIFNAKNFNPHKKPISLLNVPICTQGMQRTWWPETGTIIVTGPYYLSQWWPIFMSSYDIIRLTSLTILFCNSNWTKISFCFNSIPGHHIETFFFISNIHFHMAHIGTGHAMISQLPCHKQITVRIATSNFEWDTL